MVKPNNSKGQSDIFERLNLPIVNQLSSDERTEWVLVSPNVAQSLLGINYEDQRNIRQSRVEAYARDMANGRWNPQACNSIRISSDGKVVDGQHRLLAVIKSGVSVLMKITYGGGTASELFDFIDNTLTRQPVQFIKGKNAVAIGALSRSILCLAQGTTVGMALKGAYKSEKIDKRTVTLTPTRKEIIDYARSHIELLESITTDAKSINRSVGCNPLAIGLAMWCIQQLHDSYMLDEYVTDFLEIVPENRAVAYVQATMIRKVSQAKSQHVTVDKNWIFGVFAYGYDAFITNKDVKSVRTWKNTFETYSNAIQAKLSPSENKK